MCVASAICEALRVPVREGAICASEDDAGRHLRATFQCKLAEHGCPQEGALGGMPLRDFGTAEAKLAAQAASLADCQNFLFAALGPSNAGLITDLLA